MKHESAIIKSIRLNRSDFFTFSMVIILAQMLSTLLIKNIAGYLFDLSLVQANLAGVSNDNFLVFLGNPLSVILLVLALVSILIFMMIELTLIVMFADRHFTQEKITVKTVLKRMKKMIRPSLLLFGLYIALIMPNMNIGIVTTYAANIKIPYFIIDFMYQETFLTVIFFGLVVLAFVTNLYLHFAPVIFVVDEDIGFIDACKESYRITRHHIKDIIFHVIEHTLFTLGAGVVAFIISFVPTYLARALNFKYQSTVYAVSNTLFLFLILFVIAASVVLAYQSIVVLYHELDGTELVFPDATTKSPKWVVYVMVGVFLVSGFRVYSDQAKDKLPRNGLVVAHRGDIRRAVENSIEALVLAAEYEPGYVELDIQETKDGKIVVAHDTTMRRLAGVNVAVKDLTLSEIQSYPISASGFISRTASLDEYLEVAKELDQPLLVEIKGYNTDNFLSEMMRLVEEHEMSNLVIFQSMDKSIMNKLKENYPDTIVGYVLGFNVGGLAESNMDFYAIESGAVNERVIQSLQRQDKNLFVWTVNRRYLMERFFEMNITGIITDELIMATDVKSSYPDDSLAMILWRKLLAK